MIIEIIIFLCIVAPVIPLALMVIIWKLFFEKNAKRLQRLYRRMDTISLKINRTILSDKQPFGEIRIPAMILGISGLVYTLLTTMMGVGINWNTRTVEFFYLIDPSPDMINPMQQFPTYIWIVMFASYYVAISLMIYFWFEYCKWRWMNIPTEYRVKTVEIKKEKELFAMNGRRKS
jgi:hypothetical protein